jgi:archaellum component FlaG (FlaF/FlaG flagellin family)
MKGVSALLSAVFLILLTIVIAAFVSGWLTNISSEQSSQIKNSTTDRIGCQFADMYIVNASYDCNSNCSSDIVHTLDMYVSNSGKKNLYVERMVIQNTQGVVYVYDLNMTTPLAVGETIYLRNLTSDSCTNINGSIDKIIASSMNCASNAFDSISGSDVTMKNC